MHCTAASVISQHLEFPVIVTTDFEEDTACRDESKILCDGSCRLKEAIACDGVTQCSDWYDEYNCPGQTVSCNFESVEPCGYTLESRGGQQYKWQRNSGATGTEDTGPENDHTYGNSTGQYQYTTTPLPSLQTLNVLCSLLWLCCVCSCSEILRVTIHVVAVDMCCNVAVEACLHLLLTYISMGYVDGRFICLCAISMPMDNDH